MQLETEKSKDISDIFEVLELLYITFFYDYNRKCLQVPFIAAIKHSWFY